MRSRPPRRVGKGASLAALLGALAAGFVFPACRRAASRVTVEALPAAQESPASGASSPGAGKSSPDPFSRTRSEQRSIALFLARNPTLRLATDADAQDSDDAEDVAKLYGVYHPYFVRGDLNDDGALDFAAAFVDRQKSGTGRWFTVAVFCSDSTGGFREPEVLERAISLDGGDISIDRDCVIVTPDLSEDASRRYRWNSLRRRFDFVTDDDEAADPRPLNRI
ncbi:MAG: hypothetical protein ACRD16_12515 [Thermoanaerobaculia bacterium]